MALAQTSEKSYLFLSKVETALTRALDEAAPETDRRQKLEEALREVARTRSALEEKVAS